MKLIVGLGNPGPKYALNRHNVGFMVVDVLIENLASSQSPKTECQALTVKTKIAGDDVLLVKPQTFMNLSGASVQGLMAFYKVTPDNLLVLHDEVDIPFGKLRFQKNRGHGGQNGVRDIHEKIGSDYARIRLGVGRPTIPQMGVADWVLSNFESELVKSGQLGEFLKTAAEAALSFAEDGFLKAQNRYNTET